MKLKPLIIGVAVIAVIAGIGWWMTRPKPKAVEPDSLVAQKLLSPDILENTARIIIKGRSEDENVVIDKETVGTWVLNEYYGFEADFSKLRTLTSALLAADVLRMVTRTPERMERLGLGENSLVFQDKDGKDLMTIETGKRGNSGGRYVKIDGKPEAYLADFGVYIDADQENWAQKQLLTFKQEDVSALTVNFPNGDPALSVSRPDKDQAFVPSGPTVDLNINDDEIKSLINTLINARFLKISEPDAQDVIDAKANSRDIVVNLFNGDSYTVTVGRRPARPLTEEEIAAAEEADKESGKEEEKDTGPQMSDPGPVFFFFKSINPDDRLNAIMQRAALNYSDYYYDQLPKSRDELLQKEEEQKPATAGSPSSTVSKDENGRITVATEPIEVNLEELRKKAAEKAAESTENTTEEMVDEPAEETNAGTEMDSTEEEPMESAP